MGLNEYQLQERHDGLGGSDAAPALGLSPYQTPLELYIEKRDRRPFERVHDGLLWGTLLEPVIRQRYADLTRRPVKTRMGRLVHPQYKFLFAHVDGLTDDGRLFEAKTSRTAEGWGPGGTDQVPHDYLIQVQHTLAVAELEICDLAVLIGGSDYRLYEIRADHDLQEMIIDGETEFWQGVLTGVAPEPTWQAPDIVRIISRLYPGSNGRTVHAKDDQISWRRVFLEAVERARQYEQAAESAKAHLMHGMGEATSLVFPDGYQLRRKLVHKKSFTVPETEYMDCRFTKAKEQGE